MLHVYHSQKVVSSKMFRSFICHHNLNFVVASHLPAPACLPLPSRVWNHGPCSTPPQWGRQSCGIYNNEAEIDATFEVMRDLGGHALLRQRRTAWATKCDCGLLEGWVKSPHAEDHNLPECAVSSARSGGCPCFPCLWQLDACSGPPPKPGRLLQSGKGNGKS